MKSKLILIVLFICVTGCMNKNDMQLFQTKEKAISNFVEEQAIKKGAIIEIVLSNHETVLLIEQRSNVYYLAEVTKTKEQYASSKLSAGVSIGNTTGAMWEFTTHNGNEYTIKITKEKEDYDSIFNEDTGVFITIIQGNRDYKDRNLRNIIKGFRRIQ